MVSLSVTLSSAIIILFIGIVIANLSSKLIKRLIRESKTHKFANKKLGKDLKLDIYLSSLTKYSLYVLTFLLVLKEIGVDASQLRMAVFTVLIVLVVLIVLGFKEVIPSALFGLYLLQSKKIKTGSTININGVKGKVIGVNLVETRVETEQNEEISIPNVLVFRYIRR